MEFKYTLSGKKVKEEGGHRKCNEVYGSTSGTDINGRRIKSVIEICTI